MNMLPPMNENSYRHHVKALQGAAKSVAKESMSRAASEVKSFMNPTTKTSTILQCQEMEHGGREGFLHRME